jgi:hypothetical protein
MDTEVVAEAEEAEEEGAEEEGTEEDIPTRCERQRLEEMQHAEKEGRNASEGKWRGWHSDADAGGIASRCMRAKENNTSQPENQKKKKNDEPTQQQTTRRQEKVNPSCKYE